MLTLALALLLVGSSAWAQKPVPAATIATRRQVRQLWTALLQQPPAQRRAAAYERMVALLTPLWHNPKATGADSARFQAAAVYVAWARDRKDNAAYGKAATLLRQLLHRNPYSAYRRNAEFALAQIELFHLHQRPAARIWLRDFVRRYPADPRAALAAREEKDDKLPEPEYMVALAPLPLVPSSAPPPRLAAAAAAAASSSSATPPPPPETPRAEKQWKVGIGNIESVQVFTTSHASSVVIALRRKVSFHRGALPKHHLVYFDVSTKGSPVRDRGGEKTLRVGDGRVVKIVVADYKRGLSRVVVEMAGGAHADHGGFYPNPDRLIVGVTGASSTEAAAAHPAQPLAIGGDSLTRALGLKIHRIVLDAGHGGHDTGTIGPGGLDEKTVVLDVAKRLGHLLTSRLGVAVTYTRSTDVFVPLRQRTAIANRVHADLFVSIHANSSTAAAVRGIETYYLNLTRDPRALAVAARENADGADGIHDLPKLVRTIALNDKLAESRELASDVESGLVRASGENDRGVKTAPFVVLIGARMPSILAEISFLSNRTDDHRLRTAAYRQKLAEGLYQGLHRYIVSLGGTRTASLR